MSIHVGSIELTQPVILAPMSGVTDRPFRALVGDFGASMVVNEMIASDAVIRATRQSTERARLDDGNGPKVIQLAGCEAAAMADAARLCADLGAEVIDINMGCPVKKVVNGYAGSALMRDLDTARELIDATVGAVDLPVTLKMRTGWDAQSRNAPELARIAADSGIKMLTVHGRTRQQLFNGRADWDFIARVKQAVDIPVIANGDVNTVDDALEILAQSGADGVMVGRGAYGRPWFLSQIMTYLDEGRRVSDPSLPEQATILRHHYAEMLAYYGRHRGVRIARKHINWSLDRIGVPQPQRQTALRSEDPDVVVADMMRLYAEAAERAAA